MSQVSQFCGHENAGQLTERQFTSIRQAVGGVTHHYRIGGRPVSVRFAGRHLAGILGPAIEHLSTENSPSSSTQRFCIDVWESSRPPVTMSESEWLKAASPNVVGPREFLYAESGALTWFRGDRARICFRNASRIPPWEAAMPFRVVINAWFQQGGGQVVHAAAVATEQAAVVLGGRGGAGKSSTALSCLNHPALAWMSDDLCLLQGGENPSVASLYNSIKLRRDNLARFGDLHLPQLAHLPLEHGKPTFFLYPAYADKLADTRPIKAILLPQIKQRVRTEIVPASTSDAWRALVPSTLAVVIGDGQVGVRNISSIIARLPVYWLELGSNRESIAETIHGFLSTAVSGVA